MGPTENRLRDLQNLGIKTEEMLARVGITTPDQLRKADPFDVYALLKNRFQEHPLSLYMR